MHGVADLRQRIAKWSDGLRGIIPNKKFTPKVVGMLLDIPPAKWHEAWQRLTKEHLPDDPVPVALEEAARSMDFHDLRSAIERLPIRRSEDIANRLQRARKTLADITQTVWKSFLSSTALDLPLLIVDEAHRLKNSGTQISKLFAPRSDDAPASGAFHGVFRRMLFLTATPFELGHSELINVLGRMGAVSCSVEPPLAERLEALRKVLTTAQVSALSFDEAWGRIEESDLSAFESWSPESHVPDSISAAAREAWRHANLTVLARNEMHKALRPWVIRHERPHRRDYLTGAAILENGASGGLQIPDEAALPFLLAARAQSVALDEKGPARPLFAYGIASSYEAFSRLGSGSDDDGRDSDIVKEDRNTDDPSLLVHCATGNAVHWYRREIENALADIATREAHPKISATVDRAAKLWSQGEKCLIFSWFIRSGKAIEDALTKRIDALITEAAKSSLRHAEPDLALDRISDRLFRSDSSSYVRIRKRLSDAIRDAAGGHDDVLDLVVDTGIRHLRTPGYLVRYTPLKLDINDDQVWAGLQGENPCSIVVLDRWKLFAERLANARNQIKKVFDLADESDSEFVRISTALLGTHEDEEASSRRSARLHPVRRAYGGTERHVRERLIALFNMPFSPELLVASSVMGEGIDLHQECRCVIHHDLDWNPSVLEQRTGRLDRVGALAERIGKNIQVYEPYLAGTHDEKMFRVVKDRAQWFDIVMGRPSSSDEHTTDIEATRLPLHQKIKDALTMDFRSLDCHW